MGNTGHRRCMAGTRMLILAVGWASLVASSLRAEDDGGWRVKWDNGFKVDSEDDSVHLKFGGRIQADFTFADPDSELIKRFGANAFQDGFEFRRARVFFEGLIYERVRIKVQYGFSSGDAEAKDVFISLINDWGNLTLGHHIEPFSFEGNTSSKFTPFVERATPVTVFSAARNTGISASGTLSQKTNWGVGAFYDADDFGASLAEGRYNLTARVAYRPIYKDKGKRLLHLGLGITNREVEDGGTLRLRGRTGAHFGPRPIDTQGIPAESVFLYNLELAGVFEKAWFQGEYFSADVDSTSLGNPMFGGYYFQAGVYLTDDYRRYTTSQGVFDRQKPNGNFGKAGGKGAWEIAARYSATDLTDSAVAGGELDGLTLGLNWYLNPATRLMVDLVEASLKDVGNVRFVIVRWQVDF